jgi:hypothetical protein
VYYFLSTKTIFFLISLISTFGYCGHYWPIVLAPDDRWWWLWRNWWNEDWQRKPKYSEKTCPSAILSTTNPTWLDTGLNPGRRGGKPATNHLSYGAAQAIFFRVQTNLIQVLTFRSIWFRLYNISKFSFYFRAKTLFLNHKDQWTLFREIITVYFQNRTKLMNILSGQN